MGVLPFWTSLTFHHGLIFILGLMLSISTAQDVGKEVKCLPRPVVFETDPLHRSTVPRFYEVQRCSGGVLDPKAFQCQPSSESTSNVAIIDSTTATKRVLKVANHVQCAEVCVCQICVTTNETPKIAICEVGQKWDKNSCRCISSCKGPSGVESNQRTGNDDSISVGALVGAMFLELIVICVVGFFLFDIHRCRRQRGFLHQASVYVKSTSENTTPLNPVITRSKRDSSMGDLVFEPQDDEVDNDKRSSDQEI